MGWGIIGGAAVKQYNDQAKLSREAEWDDIKREEFLRQLTNRKNIDTAANGDDPTPAPAAQGVPMAPTPDAQAPAVAGSGLKLPSGPAPMDASLDGAPNAQQAPSAPAVPTAPVAAPAPTKQPRASDQLFARANAMMNAKGGAAGLQAATQLRAQAVETAKQERDQDLIGILQAPGTGAQKIQSLLGYINGSDTVPGQVSLEKRKDGIYMVHEADGKDKPFAMKLEGNNEQEIIANLAFTARSMFDSGLHVKAMELGETKRHNIKTEDNTAQRLADLNEYHMGLLGAKADATAARLEALGMRNAAMENKHQYVPYGVDDQGMPVFYDAKQGTIMGAQLPPGVKAFPKITGEKGANGLKLPQTLTDADKIKLPKALDALPPNATNADKIKVARSFGLNPELLGASAPPAPTAVGDMVAGGKGSPAPAMGSGLQTPSAQPGYRLSQDPQVQQFRRAIQQTPAADVQNRMRLGTMLNARIQQIQQEQSGYGTNVINDIQ